MLKNLDKFEGSGGTLFAINKDIDLSAKRMFFVFLHWGLKNFII